MRKVIVLVASDMARLQTGHALELFVHGELVELIAVLRPGRFLTQQEAEHAVAMPKGTRKKRMKRTR